MNLMTGPRRISMMKSTDFTKRLKELETEKIKKRVDRALVWDDDDDIMNDPDVREMVERGEHICHMFDGECLAV